VIIRKPVVAGYFYPKNSRQLRETINTFLNVANKAQIPGNLRALIVPHAGYSYSGIVAAVGYNLLKNKNITRAILIGPSHFIPFIGASISKHDFWETPIGKVKVEKVENDFFIDLPEAHEREHSIEVQLPFLQTVLEKFTIIPIVVGNINPKEVANSLLSLLNDSTIIIASSDLSHYHSYERAKLLDDIANTLIPKLDINGVEKKVEACGKEGILILMNIAKEKGWKGQKLYYCNSGDVTGDKDKVVGYGCYAFYD